MRIALAIILFFCVMLACEGQERKGIYFSNISWSRTLLKAKQEKKPVFLYAYTPACRYCKQMEDEVFTNQEVASFYNNKFISYKVNIEDKAEGAMLAKRYNIDGFPTYLYFNKDGQLVHQSGSLKPSASFILEAKDASNPDKALFTLKRKYDSGDRSSALLYNYSIALGGYLTQNSPVEKVVSEYLATQSAQQMESEKNLKYIFSNYLSFQSPATQYFLENQNKFIPLYNEQEVKQKAMKIIRHSAAVAGRENDAQLFKKVGKAVSANFADTSRVSTLARIYFYQGKQEWVKYAETTLKFSSGPGENDWGTMYETALYLKHFSQITHALELGTQIMANVTKAHKTYENLLLYAQLQHKVNKISQALAAAKEAIEIAEKSGTASDEAAKLIAEIQENKI